MVSATRNTIPVSSVSLDSSIANRVTTHTASTPPARAASCRAPAPRRRRSRCAASPRRGRETAPARDAETRAARCAASTCDVGVAAMRSVGRAWRVSLRAPASEVVQSPAGQPRMIATADAPTRKICDGCGFSIRIRTGKRCAMCTQLQLALDLRHAGDDRLVLGVHRPPDSLHDAAEVVAAGRSRRTPPLPFQARCARARSRGSSPRRTKRAYPRARTPASGPGATNWPMAVCRLTTSASNSART